MSSRPRKIVGVTGARSDYDLLSPIYAKLHSDERFDLELLVTGSHLSEKFGKTIDEIESDGFVISERILNLVDCDEKVGRASSIGYQIAGLSQAVDRMAPDIVLVAGDREEAISTTLVCAYMGIAVAHFFGGDIAKDGNIDNATRYASSKYAHIHFPTLEAHRENLLRLGEDDWRIHVIGNPALDKFRETPAVSRATLSERLGLDLTQHFLMLIQHSIITEVDDQAHHIRQTLEAVVETGLPCIINYPNSDAGNHAIVEAYAQYAGRYPQLRTCKNLDRETFVNLLRNARCLVGNSSAGILEAPTLGLPSVNIGTRQRGRVHGANVIFVDNEFGQIRDALRVAIYDQQFRATVKQAVNPYGDGYASNRAVGVLASVDLNEDLIYKNITY